jgi:hypothetical protein
MRLFKTYLKFKLTAFWLTVLSLLSSTTIYAAKKNNKANEAHNGDALCSHVGNNLDVLATMDACDYKHESQLPQIELYTTNMQGDRFSKDSEKWAKWTMDTNVGPVKPTPFRSGLMVREESWGGLLYDKNKDAVYKLNHRAYYCMKMLLGGYKKEEIFCNDKEKNDFMEFLYKEQIIEKRKAN